MQTLKVKTISSDDLLKDIVRLNSAYRPNIRYGELCRIRCGTKEVFAIARNAPEDNTIGLELHLREDLNVKPGQDANFDIQKARWLDELWWVWRATDPLHRTAGRLGILSLVLGCLGVALGAWSLVLSLR